MIDDELYIYYLCAIVGFFHGINIIPYCIDLEHTGFGSYRIRNIPDKEIKGVDHTRYGT